MVAEIFLPTMVMYMLKSNLVIPLILIVLTVSAGCTGLTSQVKSVPIKEADFLITPDSDCNRTFDDFRNAYEEKISQRHSLQYSLLNARWSDGDKSTQGNLTNYYNFADNVAMFVELDSFTKRITKLAVIALDRKDKKSVDAQQKIYEFAASVFVPKYQDEITKELYENINKRSDEQIIYIEKDGYYFWTMQVKSGIFLIITSKD